MRPTATRIGRLLAVELQSSQPNRRGNLRDPRALFIDDFLRAGGTARGVHDLMRECRAEVAGIGVLIETGQPRDKLVDEYVALLTFDGVDEAAGTVRIAPSRWTLRRAGRDPVAPAPRGGEPADRSSR